MDKLDSYRSYGVSEELLGLLAALAEATGRHGPKFRTQDVEKVSQAIVFRNYANPCWELAYLLLTVIQAHHPMEPETALETFFWRQEAITPQRFRVELNQCLPAAGVSLSDVGVTLALTGGESFTISPSRVGFLAALLELLWGMGIPINRLAAQQLSTPSPAKVKGFASDVQKQIYAYLKEHLQPAQQQRRFRYLYQWCQQQRPTNQPLRQWVDDQVVLTFWQQSQESSEAALGFRLYRVVAEDFMAFLAALELGAQAQQVRLESEMGQEGEFEYRLEQESADLDLASVMEAQVTWTEVQRLGQAPKFLTAKDIEPIKELVASGKQGLALPLSVMRMQVLGDWQAKLVQAERDQASARLAELLAAMPESSYGLFYQQLERFSQQTLRQAKLLGLGLMLAMASDEVWALIAQLLPPTALSALQPQLNEVLEQGVSALPQLRLASADLNQLCQEAERCFKASARAGFKTLPSREQLPEYEQGLASLECCQQQVQRYLSRLEQTQYPADDRYYAADVATVRCTLLDMYGVAS